MLPPTQPAGTALMLSVLLWSLVAQATFLGRCFGSWDCTGKGHKIYGHAIGNKTLTNCQSFKCAVIVDRTCNSDDCSNDCVTDAFQAGDCIADADQRNPVRCVHVGSALVLDD
ncbi:hypothetical protein BDZ90DRAFT_229730 [Jaminaea rosea]|uniref:Secreted protein n=1 Tax=Jaminaea rosea TaxID=1569628 RepID=A0A316V150_9BASI|nr:hypothetical protein BDZ90DRAFT_229730 [Jaminaea rosea]PWN30728.1 hypothetical protein BDZ90DRAFT_229730 [Jaminaea rosea]